MANLLRASVYVDPAGNLPQTGDPCLVLVDGAASYVTANGLAGYQPTNGDRLLVQKVGDVMEIVQFLSRGTVPYLAPTDPQLADIQASIAQNATDVQTAQSAAAAAAQAISDYQASNDAVVAGLQSSYDPLNLLGNTAPAEDYFPVFDTPGATSMKLAQISTWLQGKLYAADVDTLASLLGLWTSSSALGDITYSGAQTSPMTTFLAVFTANGRVNL